MKRNCRRTPEERSLHDRACRLRRMTDEQLCAEVDRACAGATPQDVIEGFLSSLGTRTASGARVSDATIRKLRAVAVEKGFLPGGS